MREEKGGKDGEVTSGGVGGGDVKDKTERRGLEESRRVKGAVFILFSVSLTR